jgi:UDP-2,3-diacylglucosamine hydrolase
LPSDFQTIQAPPHWRVIDFISDLHLQAAEMETFLAWRAYMERTKADALFILGDLFEVWVGDDAALESTSAGVSFEAICAMVLKQTAARLDLHLMRGNRDFLMGQSFCASTGVNLLDDPCTLHMGQNRWVLSHGDALCLADLDYQNFRKLVRAPEWQAAFLAKPLGERRNLAKALRAQSQARKMALRDCADADNQATLSLLAKAGSQHLIHGHTHKPANHVLAGGAVRHVLSDWDLAASPPRAEVFRLTLNAGAPASVSRIAAEQA